MPTTCISTIPIVEESFSPLPEPAHECDLCLRCTQSHLPEKYIIKLVCQLVSLHNWTFNVTENVQCSSEAQISSSLEAMSMGLCLLTAIPSLTQSPLQGNDEVQSFLTQPMDINVLLHVKYDGVMFNPYPYPLIVNTNCKY